MYYMLISTVPQWVGAIDFYTGAHTVKCYTMVHCNLLMDKSTNPRALTRAVLTADCDYIVRWGRVRVADHNHVRLVCVCVCVWRADVCICVQNMYYLLKQSLLVFTGNRWSAEYVVCTCVYMCMCVQQNLIQLQTMYRFIKYLRLYTTITTKALLDPPPDHKPLVVGLRKLSDNLLPIEKLLASDFNFQFTYKLLCWQLLLERWPFVHTQAAAHYVSKSML